MVGYVDHSMFCPPSNAYLLFKDQATAEANMKTLKDVQLRGEKIVVDYVGLKSEHDKNKVGIIRNISLYFVVYVLLFLFIKFNALSC